MSTPRNLLRLVSAAALLGALVLSACGSDNGGSPDSGMSGTPDAGTGADAGPSCTPIDPTFSALYDGIFGSGTCAISGCHKGPGPQNGLDFSTGKAAAYSELVGVSSPVATSFKRVVANDPSRSLLYLKVSSDSPPSGARMPLGSSAASGALTQCQQDAIKNWIAAGAMNN